MIRKDSNTVFWQQVALRSCITCFPVCSGGALALTEKPLHVLRFKLVSHGGTVSAAIEIYFNFWCFAHTFSSIPLLVKLISWNLTSFYTVHLIQKTIFHYIDSSLLWHILIAIVFFSFVTANSCAITIFVTLRFYPISWFKTLFCAMQCKYTAFMSVFCDTNSRQLQWH